MVAVVIAAAWWRERPRAAWWMGLGLLTLVAALVVNVVTDDLGGRVDDFGEHVLSPWMRVMGSAGVALGGWLGTRSVLRQPPLTTLRQG